MRHCSRELWQPELAAADRAGLVRVPHPKLEGRKLVTLWSRRP